MVKHEQLDLSVCLFSLVLKGLVRQESNSIEAYGLIEAVHDTDTDTDVEPIGYLMNTFDEYIGVAPGEPLTVYVLNFSAVT